MANNEILIITAFREAGVEFPRTADIAAVSMIMEHAEDEEIISAVAEYIWDHLLGEPAQPSARTIRQIMKWRAYVRLSLYGSGASHH